MARPVQSDLTTILTVEQLHRVFLQVTSSMASRIGKIIRANKLEQFEPEGASSMGEDVAWGANIPTLGGWHGGLVTLHMYVRDAGKDRQVRLYSPHNFGGRRAAEKALRRLEREIPAARQS